MAKTFGSQRRTSPPVRWLHASTSLSLWTRNNSDREWHVGPGSKSSTPGHQSGLNPTSCPFRCDTILGSIGDG
eukprot:scaffold2858_cov659-Pavlova_lutheri.AAC.137